MKRIITILLLICLFCSTGCAKKPEEFSIRNGIKFGMTPEEVIAIEGEPESTMKDMSGLGYSDHIDGIPFNIDYFFSNKELSYIAYYFFESTMTENEKSEVFVSINKKLMQKYGKPTEQKIDYQYGHKYEYIIWFIKSIDDQLIRVTQMKSANNDIISNHMLTYELDYEMSYSEAVNRLESDKI